MRKKKEFLFETITALCEDNSIWQLQIDHRLIYGACEIKHWKKLPDIPQNNNSPGLEEAARTTVFEAFEKAGKASRSAK